MEGEIITNKNYPNIHKWLLKNVSIKAINERWISFKNYENPSLTLQNNMITSYNGVKIYTTLKKIKYPFGYVGGDFTCSYSSELTSLKGSPKTVMGNVDVSGCVQLTSLEGCTEIINGSLQFDSCTSLESLKGLPKKCNGTISFIGCEFTNRQDKTDSIRYYKYIDMWIELLDSVSDNEKIEYVNNYKDKTDAYYKEPIIPKEVINKYKIDFLLKK